VAGVMLAITNPKARNEIFNMTYGNSRSIQELADVMRHHFADVRVEKVERDELMPFRGTLNVDKAREMLGYSPQNPIEVGFDKYIGWYRDLYKEASPSESAGVGG
jgi:nucleoside-diphosphate-sugar epimerase